MKKDFNILDQNSSCCDTVTDCCSPENKMPVAIIGGGPIGLAAASQLSARNISFMLFEKGDDIGANIRSWEHVTLFSPWQYNIDAAAKELLKQSGWKEPFGEELPTGRELIDQYLKPLSELNKLKESIHTNHQVVAITRKSLDKMKTKNRNQQPFLLYVETAGKVMTFEARAVLDATGTWGNPNPAMGNGVWLPNEKSLSLKMDYHIPDVKANSELYESKKIAVIGGGHSAIHSLLNLAKLQEKVPTTEITWILRKKHVDLAYGGEQNDELPERGALGARIRELVEQGKVKVVTPFSITTLKENNLGKISIIGIYGDNELTLDSFDRLIVNTGSRPDFSMNSELRLNIDPTTESVTALAPLIDPNEHSCGTVRPHGEQELRQPEKDFYIVGAKSYGRAPTFLLATGYEQVRSIVAYLAGDMKSAQLVQLNLPETGVCKSGLSGCC
nr:NAD(P)-binding domain-containing protein [Lysinibacillus timonensis]